jgi:hypothetical protein
VKRARVELVREVAEYLRDHPDDTANAVIVALRCRRADGLAAVRAVRSLSRLPGEPLRRFLKAGSGNGDPPFRVVSPEEFVRRLYSEGES